MNDKLLTQKELLIKYASGMIERTELQNKIGMDSRSLSALISFMRMQGHEIWSINTDTSEWFVIYKGGPELRVNKTNVLRGVMKGWMNRKELAKKSGMESYEMGGLLCGLVKKGEVIKRKVGKINEYRMASEI